MRDRSDRGLILRFDFRQVLSAIKSDNYMKACYNVCNCSGQILDGYIHFLCTRASKGNVSAESDVCPIAYRCRENLQRRRTK